MFVDDEENILSGLRRLFRSMRDDWDMVFVDGGQEALEQIERSHFDVIVSDMKMPGLNGADLLKEVKNKSSANTRIILSGHSDPSLTMRAIGPTHQFLAKPCDPDELKVTIERVQSLRALLTSDGVSGFVSEIEALPSLPDVYEQIMACLEDPDAALSDVAEIVSRDIGMTAKLLQLSNSAFFGIGRPILTVGDAVSFLGLETITALVLGHETFTEFDKVVYDTLPIKELQDASLRAAAIAGKIAQFEGMDSRECYEARMAAMMHDVGKLVLAVGNPELLKESLAGKDDPYGFDDTVIIDSLGTGIAEIGAYLLGLWGLPERIVEAVAYHDHPGNRGDNAYDVFGVVHVASRLAVDSEAADPCAPELRVDTDYLSNAGVIDRWSEWQSLASDLAQGEASAT